ncbi:Crustacyanin-C1 subunit [Halocaridina rubra]|uniref:Crustacyanin-C1 subunit n=1 Tax=Halocaridina rubra TaxID=373956 RepID=A0AAN8WQ99_HALRR
MLFATLLVVVALASVSADKVPGFVVKGQCPAVDERKLWEEQIPQHSKFGGVWYQYALTENPYQLLEQCVLNDYDFNGKSFDATSTGIDINGNLLKRTGEIAPMPLGDPHLMVAFENSFPAPLVILESDYDNYACLYSCVNYNSDYFSDFGFIHSRNPTLSDAYLKRCETAFKNIGFDTTRFLKTVQGSQCPYDTQRKL